MERIGNKEMISSYASPHLRPVAFNKLLLFTAFWAVIVTGFAIINRLRRWAKPFSGHKLWPVIAQQVRDSAVNSNNKLLKLSFTAAMPSTKGILNFTK